MHGHIDPLLGMLRLLYVVTEVIFPCSARAMSKKFLRDLLAADGARRGIRSGRRKRRSSPTTERKVEMLPCTKIEEEERLMIRGKGRIEEHVFETALRFGINCFSLERVSRERERDSERYFPFVPYQSSLSAYVTSDVSHEMMIMSEYKDWEEFCRNLIFVGVDILALTPSGPGRRLRRFPCSIPSRCKENGWLVHVYTAERVFLLFDNKDRTFPPGEGKSIVAVSVQVLARRPSWKRVEETAETSSFFNGPTQALNAVYVGYLFFSMSPSDICGYTRVDRTSTTEIYTV